jgi:Domain of unknown function (DUF2427)
VLSKGDIQLLNFAGVMLSIARSRLAVPTQLLFLALNGCGIFFGIFYNVNTPDLYENNAHHKIGWIATWVVTAQVAMSMLFAFSGRRKKEDTAAPAERAAFLPISVEAMAQHQQLHNPQGYKDIRWSRDSGQGTERASSSLQSRDMSPTDATRTREDYGRELHQKPEPEDDDNEDQEERPHRRSFLHNIFAHKFLERRVPVLFSQRTLKVLEAVYNGIDCIILVLGFIALVSGGVTYAGIFVSPTYSHRQKHHQADNV